MDSRASQRRGWAHSWSRVAAVAALLALTVGCRGPAPADVVGSDVSGGEDWYCEPAGAGGWRCASDPNGATRQPRQTPVPEPAPAAPVPQPAPPSEPAPAAQPQPVPAPQPRPAAAPRPAPAGLPLYRQLAHQLDGQSLLELPSAYYALQLFAATSPERVEEVAAEHGLQGMAGARVDRDGEIFYVLLVGIYATREAAEQAQASLPANVRAMQPWVRRVGGLQAAMRRAADAPQ